MQKELFEQNREEFAPLARRMRPRILEEFVGQERLMSPGKPLRRLIEGDRLRSMIFYGPPGVGKSVLAEIIADRTKSEFRKINAVTSSVSELKSLMKEGLDNLLLQRKRTLVFIDEIHRFNRAQQDALLPAVEDGSVILIGITTHNPYFYINPPLLSRVMIFEFFPLSDVDLEKILEQVLGDTERGLAKEGVKLNEDAKRLLILHASGDGRRLLNILEMAFLATTADNECMVCITEREISEAISGRSIRYDREEDEHYDNISAMIKSMRGGDPDATLYYLAKMLAAGEDPRFLLRRIMIAAAEDVGLADPNALVVCTSALEALEFLGMPEGKIPLSEAALYVATAPKSNSAYLAIERALEDIEKNPHLPVPDHLRDAHYRGAKGLGRGIGYQYPHNYPGHHIQQPYLSESKRFYEPSTEGYEREIGERLRRWWEGGGKSF